MCTRNTHLFGLTYYTKLNTRQFIHKFEIFYKIHDLLFPTRTNNLKYRFSLINISPLLKDHPLFPMYKTQNYLEDSSWFFICTHLCKYSHTWKCHLGQAKEPFQCQQIPVKNYTRSSWTYTERSDLSFSEIDRTTSFYIYLSDTTTYIQYNISYNP